MNLRFFSLILALGSTFQTAMAGALEALPPPPQDLGLPYTRSSIPIALEALSDGIAVFPGSRYGYVNGTRVRLSEADLLHAEAQMQNGDLLVPASFAALLGKELSPPAAVPDDLAAIKDRWVYKPSDFGPSQDSKGVTYPVTTIRGEPYVSFKAAVKAAGFTLTEHSSGLRVAGHQPWEAPKNESTMESIVTLFDTPDKFADPDIATKSIPILERQGRWTDHVRVNPDQLALINGPATEWKWTPKSEFNEKDIDKSMFGSPVPDAGLFPRLLFSEADLPAIRKRINSTRTGRKSLIEMEELFRRSWWDPSTSDGLVFRSLATGQLETLEWPDDVRPEQIATRATAQMFKDQKPGIYSSHIAYVPECLTAMALYCLIADDDERGREVASAVANYYLLREPLLDRWLEISDSEFGSSLQLPDGSFDALNGSGARTHWRNIHGLVAHMNLGLSLDLAGRWMSKEQIDIMRRIIAKATYGRRSHSQDGPARIRDINWMTWDLTHFIAVAAIEGLPGFDEEAYAAGRESVRAFCEWGVDPQGVIYESNGKTAGGLQFQLLSMVISARRGENLFAHPHWRRLLEGQVQMTSPTGKVIPNSGTQFVPHSREMLSPSLLPQWKSFYPKSRLPDFLATAAGLIGTHFPASDFNEQKHRIEVSKNKRLRLPSITYPGFVASVLFDHDLEPTAREDLDLPLDFDAPVHGVFSAYSDRTPEATWMNMMVRPNHYIGAGHHHADAGMFHFSALGVDWFTESPFSQAYTGNLHNLVIVDGKSQAEGIDGGVTGVLNGYNAAAKFLGSQLGEEASVSSADLTYAYTWRWNTQPPQIWTQLWEDMDWEMDPSPEIGRIFAGTSRMKWRPWWPNYNCSNFIATSRTLYNPMQYIFRTVGLVRGSQHWGYVIDDAKKDDVTRLYQWTCMLGGGVWTAHVAGLPPNAIALASTGQDVDPRSTDTPKEIIPQDGQPLLIVHVLGMNSDTASDLPLIETARLAGPKNKKGEEQFANQLQINHRATNARFRILMIPERAGEEFARVDYQGSTATITRNGQKDRMVFHDEIDGRTLVSIKRGEKTLVTNQHQ